jgi:sensor histidine kinase YesM
MTETKTSAFAALLFLRSPYQFWSLQVIGWAGLAFLVYFSLTAISRPTDIAYVLHPGVQSFIGIFVSWPLRYIFRATWNKPAWRRLSFNMLAVLLAALMWTVLRLVSFVWMTGEDKNFLPEFGNWYFPSILVFFVWAAIYHGIKYYLLQQEEHEELLRISDEKKAEELRRMQAESIAQEAQLKMLRYQLNPHFLFNTLNAITSLINSGRNETACKMIDQLSAFLRRSLDRDPLQTVSLDTEIQALRLYLEIEQTRFADRLNVEFEIDSAALDTRVPSLILQPLAENSIKHAIGPKEDGGTIRVRAAVVDDILELDVEDDGPGFSSIDREKTGIGVGLRNTKERLRTIYGDDFEFSVTEISPSGACVQIRIPVGEKQSIAPLDKAYA